MSSDPETLLRQADALQRQGDDAAAEPLYRAVLAQAPGHHQAAHALGLLLAQRGADAESVAPFQTALKTQPALAPYWLSYARALLRTGHPREARLVLERGRQRGFGGAAWKELLQQAQAAQEPSALDRQMELGAVHANQGRMADAIAAYRAVLAAAPDHAEAHFRLASLLSETGAVAQGFAHYMHRAILLHANRPWQADAPPHRAKHDREQADYLHTLLGLDAGAVPFHLEDGGRLPGPVLNSLAATAQRTQQWQQNRPRAIVIDDFLTPQALDKLRRYCAGSTIWRRNYDAGYIGATPEDGLACPLMAQLVEEIRTVYAPMIGQHAFRYLGAFKYDSTLSTGTNTHADNSVVNVNLYIAPDSANLDPDSGGMDIWDVQAPPGEAMRRYNSDEALARDFLAASGAQLTRIPHRANRAVIFQSDLFHKTSDCRFREGYLNKRINISLLFGHRPS